MPAHWKTIHVPSLFPGLISLPSGVDCSLGRYKVLTKIFAPNSQAYDLPWSAQELKPFLPAVNAALDR